jgi:hypothetical protein
MFSLPGSCSSSVRGSRFDVRTWLDPNMNAELRTPNIAPNPEHEPGSENPEE